MMLRDSGSNMVKACVDWGIPHFPCIGHSLHLVVGPFLLEKKKKSTKDNEDKAEAEEEAPVNDDESSVEEEANDSDPTMDEDVEEDPYSDSFAALYDQEALKNVRKLVFKLRKITKYIKNSTKCKEILETMQIVGQCEKVLWVLLDVCTRWNSTLKMLTRALELKEPITKFLKFYKSPRGKKEFCGAETKLAEVEEKEWALISGICYLLGSFDSATKLLSGKKYSSFVCAFPVLQ